MQLFPIRTDFISFNYVESDVSADSESEQSDHDKRKSSMVHQHKQKHENRKENIRYSFISMNMKKSSLLDNQGFFTEGTPRRPRSRRHLFKRTARGIYFLSILKHRAVKSRSVNYFHHSFIENLLLLLSRIVPVKH